MKWKEAVDVFQQNIDKYNDGPSSVFLNRCKLFIKNPPPKDWDGAFSLMVK